MSQIWCAGTWLEQKTRVTLALCGIIWTRPLPQIVNLFVWTSVCVYIRHKKEHKHCWRRKLTRVFCLGGFLHATPGILLQNYELQDEFCRPTRPLHHHRVATVFQQVHSASGQHLCNDWRSRDIHHLGKYGVFIISVYIVGIFFSVQTWTLSSCNTGTWVVGLV